MPVLHTTGATDRAQRDTQHLGHLLLREVFEEKEREDLAMCLGDATQRAVYLFGIFEAFHFLGSDFLQVLALSQSGMGTIVARQSLSAAQRLT